MGYTHYWKTTQLLRPENRDRLLEMCKKLVEHPDCPAVSYERDCPDNPPELSEDVIRFNGVGESGCETFFLDLKKPIRFDFCKTNRRPYDALVTAVLILAADAQYHPGDHKSWLTVASDGEPADWQKGLDLARKVAPDAKLPYYIENPDG